MSNEKEPTKETKGLSESSRDYVNSVNLDYALQASDMQDLKDRIRLAFVAGREYSDGGLIQVQIDYYENKLESMYRNGEEAHKEKMELQSKLTASEALVKELVEVFEFVQSQLSIHSCGIPITTSTEKVKEVLEKAKSPTEMIKTKFLESKALWSAYITHNGCDYQEYGETEAAAIHFIITRHPRLAKFKPN